MTATAPPAAELGDGLDAPRAYRHPGDLLRVVLGASVVLVAVLAVRRGEVSPLERDLFRLLNDLPGALLPFVWLVMQAGALLAVPVTAGAALLGRRVALARDLLVSGGVAYLVARVLKGLVDRERPGGLPVGAVLHHGTSAGAGFVSGHCAVSAALAAAAAPYLPARLRRSAWTVAGLVALARVYVGAHLPLDVVGGAALGWCVAALVHLALGVPRLRPDPAAVAAALALSGLPVRGLRPAALRASRSSVFLGEGPQDRPVLVKVLDRDRPEADRLVHLARTLALGDHKDAEALAPLDRQVEHEAALAMAARGCGIRVPDVLLAAASGGTALLVQQLVPAQSADRPLSPGELRAVWDQVARLHAVRLAHGDLVASNLLLGDGGEVWLTDFGNARAGVDDVGLADDVAELLASLALRSPPPEVVEAAVAALGPAAVERALSGLAPLSLTRETRELLRARPGLLGEVADAVRSATGAPPAAHVVPRPDPRGRALVTAGLALLLGGLPMLAGTTGLPGGWRRVGVAVVLAVLAQVARAVAVRSAVDRRLGTGRVAAALMVADAAAVLEGPAGGRRALARFLSRSGVRARRAERALASSAVRELLAGAAAAVVTVVVFVTQALPAHLRAPSSVLPLTALAVAVLALVAVGQRRTELWTATPTVRPDRQPTIHGLVVAGAAWAVLAVLLEAGVLAASTRVVGATPAVVAVAAAWCVARLLPPLVGVPAAPGAVDVLLVLALVALGLPLAAAATAVLLARLLVVWLPMALGAVLAGRLEGRLLL